MEISGIFHNTHAQNWDVVVVGTPEFEEKGRKQLLKDFTKCALNKLRVASLGHNHRFITGDELQ